MASKRLQIEAKKLATSPNEGIYAFPSAKDILVWYFLIIGPKDTPYAGGEYVGRIRFPANYLRAPFFSDADPLGAVRAE